MVARYVGSSLGLLAFAVAAIGGLYAQNPPFVILSRSVLALFLFCFIGLALGGAAQLVINEHARQRRTDIEERFRVDALDQDVPDADVAESGKEDNETVVA